MKNIAFELEKYAEEYAASHTTFDWVESNCCLFVNGWVKRVTGVDHMADLRKTTSKLDAARLIRELGDDLKGAATKLLGVDPIHKNFAQTGDTVLIETEDEHQVLGICENRFALCLNTEGALSRLDINQCICAWRTGAVK